MYHRDNKKNHIMSVGKWLGLSLNSTMLEFTVETGQYKLTQLLIINFFVIEKRFAGQLF